MLSLLAAAAACAQAGHAGTQGVQACGVYEGVQLTSLATSDGRPVYVETPSTVRLRNGIAMFGEPTLRWESSTVFLDRGPDTVFAGVVVHGRDSVSMIPWPPGSGYFRDPIAISDGRGGADVFWGTAVSPDSLRSINGIAHAHFDGRRWSRPEQLVVASRLQWTRSFRGVARRGNEVILVTPGYATVDGQSRYGVVWISKTAERTRVVWDDLGRFVGPVALQSHGDGTIQAFYVTTLEMGSRGPVYGLFSRTTSDSIDFSGLPRLIRAFSPDSTANILRVVRTGRIIHLLWVETARSRRLDDAAETVWHVMSNDAGVAFSNGEPLHLPDGTAALEVVAAHEGVIVVLNGGRTLELRIAEWREGRWGAIHKPFSDISMSTPMFVAAADRTPLLTWGIITRGVVPKLPSYPAPSSRMAMLAPRCPTAK